MRMQILTCSTKQTPSFFPAAIIISPGKYAGGYQENISNNHDAEPGAECSGQDAGNANDYKIDAERRSNHCGSLLKIPQDEKKCNDRKEKVHSCKERVFRKN